MEKKRNRHRQQRRTEHYRERARDAATESSQSEGSGEVVQSRRRPPGRRESSRYEQVETPHRPSDPQSIAQTPISSKTHSCRGLSRAE